MLTDINGPTRTTNSKNVNGLDQLSKIMLKSSNTIFGLEEFIQALKKELHVKTFKVHDPSRDLKI